MDKIHQTLEEAQASIPAGSKRLTVFLCQHRLASGYVVAQNSSSAVDIFARSALGVTADYGDPSKRRRKTVKERLGELLAAAEAAKSKDAQELAKGLKSLRDDLESPRKSTAESSADESSTSEDEVASAPYFASEDAIASA